MKQLPQGVVSIKGKEYQTVALRVSNFRTANPDHSLVTEVIHRDIDCVVMKATIADKEGRVIATGHAEEYRKASEINRTSALENAETSAIGRALAAFGIGGTEFASANEVERAVSGEKPAVDEIDRTLVMKVRNSIAEKVKSGLDMGVLQEWEISVDMGEAFASAVWAGLTTPERDKIRELRGAKA